MAKKPYVSERHEKQYPTDVWKHLAPKPCEPKGIYCCGIYEFHGILNHYTFDGVTNWNQKYDHRTPEELMKEFQRVYHDVAPHRPFWIFSAPKYGQKTGDAFADYIEKNELGTIWRSGFKKNYNSGNMLQMYVWTVDKDRLEDFKVQAEE